jgi:hypothetical protein
MFGGLTFFVAVALLLAGLFVWDHYEDRDREANFAIAICESVNANKEIITTVLTGTARPREDLPPDATEEQIAAYNLELARRQVELQEFLATLPGNENGELLAPLNCRTGEALVAKDQVEDLLEALEKVDVG